LKIEFVVSAPDSKNEHMDLLKALREIMADMKKGKWTKKKLWPKSTPTKAK
jgi:hypothetical protein